MNNKKGPLKDQRVLLAFVIVTIVMVVLIVNPKFIAVKNLTTIFQQISVIGILIMATSMLLISRGIDLSVGNIMVLSGVVMAQIINTSRDIPLAATAGIGATITCGVLNGFVIAKSKCIPLITTLGTSQVFYGLALTILGDRIMDFEDAFNTIGETELFDIFPVMLFMLAAMVMLSHFLMNKTGFGRHIVTIDGNEKDAFLSGINVTRYKIIVCAIAGFFCAMTAVIFSAKIDSIIANAGTGHETSVLTAAVIDGVAFDGGKGTVSGAFLGCVLIGAISNAMNILQVETCIQTIIIRTIIVCAVVLNNINNVKKK